MRKFICLTLLLTAIKVNAQWENPITIQGDSNTSFGESISYSSDGNILAIGAPANKGLVRVYQNNNGTWTQIGNDLVGENNNDRFGISLDLSSDGTVLAIGAVYNKGNSNDVNARRGEVKVFKNIGGTWQQLGNDIHGYRQDILFGRSVAIDDSGTTLIVGVPNENRNGYQRSGSVQIYSLNSSTSTWDYLQVLAETGNDAALGSSIAISPDGNTIVAGAPFYDHPPLAGGYHGLTRIYTKSSSGYFSKTKDIYGVNTEESGKKVTINNDGTVIAIGSPSYHGGIGRNTGRVRIFKNNSGNWSQLGTDILGTQSEDYFGADISLSNDGTTVAIGASRLQNTSKEGMVKVFNFNTTNNSWNQLGNDLSGSSNTDIFGGSVSLNSEGNKLVIGASGLNNVTSYTLNQTTASIEDLTLENFSIYPNPAKKEIQIKTTESIRSLTIYNAIGKKVKEVKLINYIEINTLANGIYLLKVQTKSGKLGVKRFIKE